MNGIRMLCSKRFCFPNNPWLPNPRPSSALKNIHVFPALPDFSISIEHVPDLCVQVRDQGVVFLAMHLNGMFGSWERPRFSSRMFFSPISFRNGYSGRKLAGILILSAGYMSR